MGFEPYVKAEVSYRAEIERLDHIARYVYNSDHGSFLIVLADAWLLADLSNKRILQPAWRAIITKYDLDKEAEEVE